jgi:hypothetical protein
MNEAELRSLVRTAVARHLGHAPPAMPVAPMTLLSSGSLYAGLVNVTDDCLIEPAVKCDHCGYCKSHGH